MRKRIGYGWWVAVWLGGCAPGPLNSEHTLTVFAAASLSDVVTELAEDYQRAAPASLRISTGASGALCTQIEQGAPCDLFLSADPALTRRLSATGRLLKDAPHILARNRLVLAVATKEVLDAKWPGALTSPAVRRIAIADPDTAPAGRYAREALVSLKLWDALQPKLVRAGDVRRAAHYLALHTVQAAIVYQTDADATEGLTPVYVFDETTHTPIEYVGAVVASKGTKHGDSSGNTRVDSAHDFLAFVGSAAAAPVWRKHGFVPVATGARQFLRGVRRVPRSSGTPEGWGTDCARGSPSPTLRVTECLYSWLDVIGVTRRMGHPMVPTDAAKCVLPPVVTRQ